jgi:hypothetical protein
MQTRVKGDLAAVACKDIRNTNILMNVYLDRAIGNVCD